MKDLEKIKEEKMKGLKERMSNDNKKVKIEVNKNDFEEKVINKSEDVPVVVDFWAQWCQPCLVLGPRLEKIADEYEGKFILAKLNIENNQGLAQKYGIRSIPAVKMFRNGEVVDQIVGALPEQQIRNWIDKNL